MKTLQLSIIMLLISPIFIQTSFASDSSIMTGKSTLHCQNNYYDISYQIHNATVSNVTAHSNFDMIFDIQNSKKGIITVYIPKNFLRESIPTNPIDTGVFVNGQWLNSKDTSNSTHRIRTIDLPDGRFGLEFQAIGYPETMQGSKMSCSIVPEFPFAIPILLISISSMIIFYRLNIRK
jgi:archaellum component FlaG (FlaF/FlaG flagellin family)